LLTKVYDEMTSMVEDAIDRMKTSAHDVAVIVVGGGSVLLPPTLKGASDVIRTKNHGVANAIGSAIAQVSGQIERVFSLDELGREKTIEKAKNMALEEAVRAGANIDTCEIVDIEDVPLAYL